MTVPQKKQISTSSAIDGVSWQNHSQKGGHMLKSIVYLILLFVVTVSSSYAQRRGFGLGVVVGEPTGVSAKGWISPRGAVDGAIAWSTWGDGYVDAHVDYLWHFDDIARTDQQVLPYIGVGGRVLGWRDRSRVGLRIPAGFDWLPSHTPLDVFLEVAPIVDLAPGTDLNMNGGIGVRIFFR